MLYSFVPVDCEEQFRFMDERGYYNRYLAMTSARYMLPIQKLLDILYTSSFRVTLS